MSYTIEPIFRVQKTVFIAHFAAIIIGILFLVGVNSSFVQAQTTEQLNQWDQSINSLFDSHGNLIDIQKYDQAYLEINQKFQAWPFPLKAIFNNHRIQANFVLSPNRIKPFGINVTNETITSFTLGVVSDPTMQLTLNIQTLDEIQNAGYWDDKGAGIAQAIKDGRIKVETNDPFANIAISLYKLFI